MTFDFAALLAIEPLSEDRFVIRPPGNGFLFGGLSMAMILRAAGRTAAEDKRPMSLHATFLASGDWGGPHEFVVQRVSDTRSFQVRRVEMITEGRLAVVGNVVFHGAESGDDWQANGTAPDAPAPEALEPIDSKLPGGLIDLRPVDGPPTGLDKLHPYWSRPAQPPGDPRLLECALAYNSDYGVSRSVFPRGTGRSADLLSRTYTHELVFHRPITDGWWFFDCAAQSVFGGRFYSQGTVRDRAGVLLASFDQQGYVRAAR
jgi:acyl-CoA thioesterase-2